MPCPDPACTHRTEFSPVDQEQDIKLSQSILARSRSDQTDGEVLVGVDVTSCQQPPQRQRQVRRKLCVSLHQSLTKLLKRNKCSGSLPARWGETRHTSHCSCAPTLTPGQTGSRVCNLKSYILPGLSSVLVYNPQDILSSDAELCLEHLEERGYQPAPLALILT